VRPGAVRAPPGRIASPASPGPHRLALPFAPVNLYAGLMSEPTTSPSSSRSLGRMVVAVMILAVAAWVLLHIVIGIVSFLLVPVIAVVAIVAVVWALRVLL
jgi:hypothetical protein